MKCDILDKHQVTIICFKCGTLIDGWTWDDLFECPMCGTRMDHINFDPIEFYDTEDEL